MSETVSNIAGPSTELAGAFPVHAEHPPLRVDESGTVRIGKGRITLDLIVEEFENGMSPEDMVQAYEVLKLPDVYGAIAYYLRHQEEVKAYIKRREAEADELERKIKATQKPLPTRAELLARRDASVNHDVAPGQ
jgi:uncharacterized protein (DUF433 family)